MNWSKSYVSTLWALSFSVWLAGSGLEGGELPEKSDATWIEVADAADLQGFDARWSKAAAELGVPGYAVAIVKDGRLYAVDCGGFGARDQTRPINENTIFYIASITKTYTALALAILADVEEVDLDEVARVYLDRLQFASGDAADRITVRDLLCHRPGINQGTIVFLDAYVGQITEDRFYHWLQTVVPTFEVTYTNVHFTIAGRVIEAVTGSSWKDFLHEEIFAPAGMKRTTAYASLMYADPNAAFPMIEVGGNWVESPQRKTDSVMHAAGGMGTTALDGARWIELFLGRGDAGNEPVVSPDVIDEALEYQSRLPRPDGSIRRIQGFGLGWFLGEYRGRRYAQHGGGYVGTAAHISFLPDDNLGVVVLANGSPGGQAFGTIVSIDVYDRLLGEVGHSDLLGGYVDQTRQRREEQEKQREQRESGPRVTNEAWGWPLAVCAGVFGHPHWGEIQFEIENGQLIGAYGDMRVDLFADAKAGVCRAVTAFGPSEFRFERHESGAVDDLFVDGRHYQRITDPKSP